MNTYPVKEMIIVDDSGNKSMHEAIKRTYPDYNYILHPVNLGFIRSIDIGYLYVETEYFFHCEDDWEFYRPGFIEASLDILEANEKIFTVWLRGHNDTNKHPIDSQIYSTRKNNYQYMSINFSGWHGFTFNPGLRRLKDYKLIKPFASFLREERDAVYTEQRIGQAYFELGFRSAILPSGFVRHIGNRNSVRQYRG